MTAVRTAMPADVPVLARLQLQVALVAYAGIFPPEAPPPTVPALEADWERRLDQGRGFVTEQCGAIVGVVVAGADSDDRVSGHLSRLYVDETRWGQGLGLVLHDAALDHLRADGFGRASLWVLEGNQRARSWYERLGWSLTPDRKAVYEPGGVDDVRYTRIL